MMLQPLRTKPYLAVAIPSSLVSEAPDLREKTRKVGYIGRALAIFRAEEVHIYIDDGSRANAELIKDLLVYLETPPYLRKRLIKHCSHLAFAGVLPPLKIPSHVGAETFGCSARLREGVVLSSSEIKSLVDVGLSKNLVVRGIALPVGARVTVEVLKDAGRYLLGKVVSRDEVDVYWGYTVKIFNSIKELLAEARAKGYLTICCTKKGEMLFEVEDRVTQDLMSTDKMLLLFGGPREDVDEIVQREGADLKEHCSYIINFVPRQGVESIRTEEAVMIVLALINYMKERRRKQLTPS